jgi:hypothetical protein
MARDSSGNYSRIHNWTQDLANNIKIIASRMDAEDDSIATALTNSLDRSAGGGGNILRDVDITNHKFTTVGNGTARTDSVNLGQLQDSSITFFGTTLGTSTAYTIAPTPSITAYATGMRFLFKVDQDCGVDPTLNISAVGAKNLKKYLGGSKFSIKTKELQTNIFYEGLDDGTDIVVLNPTSIPVAATIASGVISYLAESMILTGESGSADDLATINGGKDGLILIISESDAANDITIKHGTGNIELVNELDVTLVDTEDRITLQYSASLSKWVEISRSLKNSFRTGSGYYYLPGNKLVQFGTYNSGAHSPTVTFGIAFDSIDIVTATTTITSTLVSVTSKTTTNFVGSQRDTAGSAVTVPFYWQAIGTKAQ